MKWNPNRRMVLKWMGVQLALPLVSTVVPLSARAQAATRKRFIGVYFPNGAYMPGGANGSWTWAGALEPLVTAGFKNNAMIIRGLFNGFPGVDPHWQNTAAFLSCKQIVLGDPGVARCGKTLDQYVADKYPAPMRSLEVGAPYYHIHPLNDHPGYSNDYLNRISWQTDDKFRSLIADPRQMFQKLFGVTNASAAQIEYLHGRRKSVLDQLYKDANRLASRLPGAYRPVLETYMDSVREVEKQLPPPGGSSCKPSSPGPTQSFADPQRNYVLRYQLFNAMVVQAMQCGSVNAATFMYGPSSSDIQFLEALGSGPAHHGCAHHKGNAGLINRLEAMTRIQSGLLADLLTRLAGANLLAETLVLYGSDMSDGDAHNETNLPVLLCGAGADLKLGQEVGAPSTPRPLSDLLVEIARLLGLTVSSFGEGRMASTGQPLGIRA